MSIKRVRQSINRTALQGRMKEQRKASERAKPVLIPVNHLVSVDQPRYEFDEVTVSRLRMLTPENAFVYFTGAKGLATVSRWDNAIFFICDRGTAAACVEFSDGISPTSWNAKHAYPPFMTFTCVPGRYKTLIQRSVVNVLREFAYSSQIDDVSPSNTLLRDDVSVALRHPQVFYVTNIEGVESWILLGRVLRMFRELRGKA